MALKDFLNQAKTKKDRDTAVMKISAQQDMTSKLQGSESLADLLRRASEVRKLVDAHWVYAWALEDETLVTSDGAGAEVRVPVQSAGIPGHCARTGEVINITDVYDKNELRRINPKLTFDTKADKAAGYRTRQVLCSPVVFRGEVIGVLHAINTLNADRFNFLEVDALTEMAQVLGPLMQHVIDLDSRRARRRPDPDLAHRRHRLALRRPARDRLGHRPREQRALQPHEDGRRDPRVQGAREQRQHRRPRREHPQQRGHRGRLQRHAARGDPSGALVQSLLRQEIGLQDEAGPGGAH